MRNSLSFHIMQKFISAKYTTCNYLLDISYFIWKSDLDFNTQRSACEAFPLTSCTTTAALLLKQEFEKKILSNEYSLKLYCKQLLS